MKRLATLVVAALMIFGGVSVASDANGGAYIGVEQEFFGNMDIWAGYEWLNVNKDVSFTVETIFGDIWAINDGPDLSIGLSYEVDRDIMDFDVWNNISFNNFRTWPDVYVDVVDVGARIDISILPSPCEEVGPCYNPSANLYVEVGLLYTVTDSTPGNNTVGPAFEIEYAPWGGVGFEFFF